MSLSHFLQSQGYVGLRWAVIGCVIAAAALLSTATAFAEVPTDKWWLVGCGYGRLQVFALALLMLLAAPLLVGGRLSIGLSAVFAVIVGIQLWHVERHNLRFWVNRWEHPSQAPSQLSVQALNVKMDGERSAAIRALVQDTDADVLLLLEVDQAWLEHLRPALSGWPHQVLVPRDDYYGLVMLSRREVVNHEVVQLGKVPRPGVWMDVRTDAGIVRVWGLHPEPPHPGTDADRKAVYMGHAADLITQSPYPVVVIGDLNDVPWSRSSRAFLAESGLDDPRVGRGLFATFDARYWWMRWPIDHVYLDRRLECMTLAVGDAVGSDHFPVRAAVSLRP